MAAVIPSLSRDPFLVQKGCLAPLDMTERKGCFAKFILSLVEGLCMTPSLPRSFYGFVLVAGVVVAVGCVEVAGVVIAGGL